MGRIESIRAALAGARRISRRLGPHDFESAMLFLSHPTVGPSVASVPHIVTPNASARCTREGCGRPRGDPIHRIPEP